MKARDIMTAPVVSVAPQANVQDIAKLLLAHRISAVPVVDASDNLIGIISEGDLMRRSEIGTEEHHRSWWLQLISDSSVDAREYVKSHSKAAEDLMTRDVVTADVDTPIAELATLLEQHRVKRLPILDGGKLVGIVSRANILQALTADRTAGPAAPSTDDQGIRAKLLDELQGESWAGATNLNVIVADGIVHYYGLIDSEDQRRALKVAAENIPGVKGVEDHLGTMSRYYHSGI